MSNTEMLFFYIYMFFVHIAVLLIPLYIFHLNKKRSSAKITFKESFNKVTTYYYGWISIPITLVVSQYLATYLYVRDTISRGDGSPPGGFFYYGVFVVPFFWFTLTAVITLLFIFLFQRKNIISQKLLLYVFNMLVAIGTFFVLLIGLVMYFWLFLV